MLKKQFPVNKEKECQTVYMLNLNDFLLIWKCISSITTTAIIFGKHNFLQCKEFTFTPDGLMNIRTYNITKLTSQLEEVSKQWARLIKEACREVHSGCIPIFGKGNRNRRILILFGQTWPHVRGRAGHQGQCNATTLEQDTNQCALPPNLFNSMLELVLVHFN